MMEGKYREEEVGQSRNSSLDYRNKIVGGQPLFMASSTLTALASTWPSLTKPLVVKHGVQ
jgi:hypothetical protein